MKTIFSTKYFYQHLIIKPSTENNKLLYCVNVKMYYVHTFIQVGNIKYPSYLYSKHNTCV